MKFFHNVTAKIAPAFSSKAALKSTAPQNKAPERTEKKVRSFRFFAAGLVLAAVSGLLGLCARTVPGFAQFYSVTVYPLLAGTLGRLCSLFPFSLSEDVYKRQVHTGDCHDADILSIGGGGHRAYQS